MIELDITCLLPIVALVAGLLALSIPPEEDGEEEITALLRAQHVVRGTRID